MNSRVKALLFALIVVGCFGGPFAPALAGGVDEVEGSRIFEYAADTDQAGSNVFGSAEAAIPRRKSTASFTPTTFSLYVYGAFVSARLTKEVNMMRILFARTICCPRLSGTPPAHSWKPNGLTHSSPAIHVLSIYVLSIARCLAE